VERQRIYMAWLTPAMYAPGDSELDLVGDMLANGKTARLYKTLVYERRVALDVSAAQQSREMAGYFVLAVTAAPGASLTDLAAAVDEEIARLAAEGPTSAEMERAEAQAEANFIYHLQTVGGFDGKSDQLNAYNVLRGDPGFFAKDLDRYRHATPESVRAAAQQYLRPDRRVVLSVVPRGRAADALAGSEPVAVS
jgi:zinc protease